MQILGLLGMCFDAAVVFVTNSSLLFRLPLHTVISRWVKMSQWLCQLEVQN